MTTDSALTELHHLIQSRDLPPSAWNMVTEKLRKQDLFVTPVDDKFVNRTLDVVAKYGGSGLDYADASIIAAAEFWNTALVATLDHHFYPVRPLHVDYLEIVPSGRSASRDR